MKLKKTYAIFLTLALGLQFGASLASADVVGAKSLIIRGNKAYQMWMALRESGISKKSTSGKTESVSMKEVECVLYHSGHGGLPGSTDCRGGSKDSRVFLKGTR